MNDPDVIVVPNAITGVLFDALATERAHAEELRLVIVDLQEKGMVLESTCDILSECLLLAHKTNADLGQVVDLLAMLPGITDEDRSQFAQLVGYSVGGYGDLPYALDVSEADRLMSELLKKAKQ